MRATFNYARMRKALREIKLPRIFSWRPKPGSGWQLAYRLIRVNHFVFTVELLLAAVSAVLFYAPPLFLRMLVSFLEVDPNRENKGWGWVYVIGIFAANAISFLSKSCPVSYAPCTHLLYQLLGNSGRYQPPPSKLDLEFSLTPFCMRKPSSEKMSLPRLQRLHQQLLQKTGTQIPNHLPRLPRRRTRTIFRARLKL